MVDLDTSLGSLSWWKVAWLSSFSLQASHLQNESMMQVTQSSSPVPMGPLVRDVWLWWVWWGFWAWSCCLYSFHFIGCINLLVPAFIRFSSKPPAVIQGVCSAAFLSRHLILFHEFLPCPTRFAIVSFKFTYNAANYVLEVICNNYLYVVIK